MTQRLFTTAIALTVISLLHLPAAAIAQDNADDFVKPVDLKSTELKPANLKPVNLKPAEPKPTEEESFSKTKQGFPINPNDSATVRMVRMCETFLSDRLGSSFTANINSVRASYVSNTETRYIGRGNLDNSRRNCEDYRFNCIVNISQSFVSTATATRTGCRMW